MIFNRLANISRSFTTSAIRRGHSNGGVPGENLPFDTNNTAKFTIVTAIYLSTGMAIPFLIVRHQLLKSNS
ncbi:hypothetical protein LSTR_LSTR003263 [Laodelphax striatellus]|uniref:Cytochrome c oxidase subunit 7C, mitochondrial n=1 Tax=Laodelphax striatellus TaxID=195883 RepID=A0A482XSA5_LAOST|nr:hypothetical protein LSTR_LSTR003263 [Laodelphax striatellus]